MTTLDDDPSEAASPDQMLRLGQAAEMLRVSLGTLRRWSAAGQLEVVRSTGGQRLVALSEVTRLAATRRGTGSSERRTMARSARNTFTGIVTRVEADRIAAVVEVQSGPHRLVSLMTAEAVRELGLRVGDEAVCVVKATNVIVEVPVQREGPA